MEKMKIKLNKINLNKIINRYSIAYSSGLVLGSVGNVTNTPWISITPAIVFGSFFRGNILPGSTAYNMMNETQQKEFDEHTNKTMATFGFYALGVATAYLDKIIPIVAKVAPQIQQGIEQLLR